MPNSYIAGLGHYLPERIVTNKDLEKIMDTTDEWIVERTGINSRQSEDMSVDSTSNMGTRAALKALESINWTGNIRELRNVIERLIILCDEVITAADVKRFTSIS